MDDEGGSIRIGDRCFGSACLRKVQQAWQASPKSTTASQQQRAGFPLDEPVYGSVNVFRALRFEDDALRCFTSVPFG